MQVQASQIGRVAVVAVYGRIDHEHTTEFQVALDPYVAACKEGHAPLLLDFSNVEYISSVGLRALMLFNRTVTVQKGKIAIAALQPVVLELFEISRFNLVYQIHDTTLAGAAALEG